MTSNSFSSCFREVRAERRANDLTVEAIVREVTRSTASMISNSVSAVVGWYAAYDKRQQRRRHHYRRAMNAISARRYSVYANEPSLPMVVSPKLAEGPFTYFAGGQPVALRNPMMDVQPATSLNIPAAHVCADASRREGRLAAS